MDEKKVTYFAQTDSRNKKIPFGLKSEDRTKHVYVIGKTGMGKSTLLENMAVQDIQGGEGMCFIDPHGKTAELLLEYIPEHRVKDVLYFAPFDLEHPVCFNVLEKVDADKRHLVVSGLMSTFKKIWVDAWSARMEYILGNTLLALLEYPDATLLGVNRMLADKEYRKKVVDNVTDPAVKSFWIDEFGKYTEKFAAEATPAIQNKIGQFTSNALIRNMIGQPQSSFDFRKMMDERKIIIVNLSKGRIGESNANLLGGMLITKIYLSAMSRADVPARMLKTLPNFYLFVDEFQSFANESFADILSEARKYKLNLTIAHQYIEQMEEEVRAAVFGNVGTMITFRVGAYDAEVLEKEFAPQFTAEDLVNLGVYQIYLKLMIDGVSSQPFSANTLPPIKEPEVSYRDKAVETSRAQYSKDRTEVEAAIIKWHEPIVPTITKRKEGEFSKGGNQIGPRVSGSGVLPPEIKRQVMEYEGNAHIKDRAPQNQSGNSHPHATKPIAKPIASDNQVRHQSENNSEHHYEHQVPGSSKAPGLPKVGLSKASGTEPRQEPNTAPVTHQQNTPHVKPAEAVGLNTLAPHGTKNTGKIPTEKNINELKNALAGVLKNIPEHKSVPLGASKGIKGPADLKKGETKKEEEGSVDNTSHHKKPAEIPEDVLKKLLKVSE